MAILKKFRILKFKSKPTLVLKNVSKSFGKRSVLDKISFELNQSEIFGVLGPNGSGKTTIFNSIMGIIRADYGEIYINNININDLPIHERATKFKIGYIPQNSSVFLGLNCKENITAISEIIIKNDVIRKQRVLDLLAEFNLDHLQGIKAKHLSGGERKRLCIAMALVSEPKLLLMDEPFAALDLLTIEMIKKIILLLQKKNISIIITDHNAKDLLNISDRCIIISNGKKVITGNPREIISDENAKKLYFGENFKF